nr:uncharacterized protein LOC128687988 isoform X2 [Cherax quadricarinatus]
MMKTLLFVVVFTALLSAGSLASVHQATCYTDHNKGGSYQTFTDYIPDLLTYNFDNQISSVTVTGIWIFYERANFAAGTSVYWVHGFNYFTNFDGGYDNAFSSLRYGGSTSCLNCDTWTVYLDLYFSGSEYYGTTDTASLGSLQKEVSSILLTGISPWTFYNGPSYTGSSVCLYPSTDQDTDGAGSVLNIGLYPDVTSVGIYDNSIQSVRKGCWSKKVIRAAAEVKAQGKAHNGAWGHFKVTDDQTKPVSGDDLLQDA